MTEAQREIQRACLGYLNTIGGGLFVEWLATESSEPFNPPGHPDIVGTLVGLFIGFKIVNPGESIDGPAFLWAAAASRCGGFVAPVSSVSEVQEALRAWNLIA